jgi:hypothetical protein
MLGLGAPADAKGAGDLPWPQADHIPAGDHGALLRWQVGDGFEEVQVDLGGGRGCGREGRGGELNVLVEPAGQGLMGADPPPPPPDVVVGDLPYPGAGCGALATAARARLSASAGDQR